MNSSLSRYAQPQASEVPSREQLQVKAGVETYNRYDPLSNDVLGKKL